MSTAPRAARRESATRGRAIRTVSGVASAGLLAGVSLVGASPALAATDADCNDTNTVDAATGTAADIQTLFDASEPVVCLSGTFHLTSALNFGSDVTVHGLVDAELDGSGLTTALWDTGIHSLTVENLRFTNGSNNLGGAIECYEVLVYNSQFENNAAPYGGAIWAWSTATIYDSTFSGNQADAGGAVMAYGVSATRSTFSSNDASQIGGAIYAYDVASSDSSTFDANTAFGGGGAIGAGTTVDVQNSTFVDNSTTADGGYGGAIYSGAGTVRQSTFLDNSADAGTSIAASTGTIELRGNIFAASTATAQLTLTGGSILDAGANLFTTTVGAESALGPVDPTSRFGLTPAALFAGATLADNGGPTETVALHAGSPALNAVPADPQSMTVDQRGVVRPAVGDAGAFEFTGSTAVLAATGSETTDWLATVAGLLLAVGVVWLWVARRVRRITP